MVKKHYDWENAKLDAHSERKHKILREYFRKYLITRCQLPQQEKFRLAIIDAFAGGGKYTCGSFGSPLIFIDELKKTLIEINLTREANGEKPIELECLLIFNDIDSSAISILKKNVASIQDEIKDIYAQLHIYIQYFSNDFESIYPDIKASLIQGRYRNVMFNLDQYGYIDVNFPTIRNIFHTWKSAEAFLTFSIETILTYLSTEKGKNSVLTRDKKLLEEIYALKAVSIINKNSWLGLIEQILFGKVCECAPFTSPFSIHNPNGWSYWLVHLANSYRARQVYNDVLHENSTFQAHFGRSGLRMLSCDPSYEGNLYLFEESSRVTAKHELYDDIPKFILEQGDATSMMHFYATAYNETSGHSDDIHEMMMENSDIEILTPTGNPRRSIKTITPLDTLRVKNQRSFFPMFFTHGK